MASLAATKRLTKEYRNISLNPPPYIAAHPNEENILEWHYIITGPPETPYENGQYWGTLLFPPDYPFAPPAIRMYTPSGRFQPGTRLCLSISDFHPKSFNPAWEVSTILNGLLSFMTGDEMTTGSVQESYDARRAHALRSRWWNSTGGGSITNPLDDSSRNVNQAQAIRNGDRGDTFRREFPEVDAENWKHIRDRHLDPRTGRRTAPASVASTAPTARAAGSKTGPRRRTGGQAGVTTSGAIRATGTGVTQAGSTGVRASQSWLSQHKYVVGAIVFFGYVLATRMFGPGLGPHAAGSV